MALSLEQHFREPVNGLMHLAGLVLSIIATVALVARVGGDPLRALSSVIYGVTMCGCFLASSMHHLFRGSRATEMRLLRIDHAAIYPFIAGSYTPVCLQLLPGLSGRVLLGVVWVIAIVGVVYKLAFARDPARVEDPPDLASTMLYVAMGWLSVTQGPAILAHSHGSSIILGIIGGISYTVGGLILSRRWLDFWPGKLGHHEIWHVCVLIGAACLYGFVFLNLTA